MGHAVERLGQLFQAAGGDDGRVFAGAKDPHDTRCRAVLRQKDDGHRLVPFKCTGKHPVKALLGYLGSQSPSGRCHARFQDGKAATVIAGRVRVGFNPIKAAKNLGAGGCLQGSRRGRPVCIAETVDEVGQPGDTDGRPDRNPNHGTPCDVVRIIRFGRRRFACGLACFVLVGAC